MRSYLVGDVKTIEFKRLKILKASRRVASLLWSCGARQRRVARTQNRSSHFEAYCHPQM
jgi:hypothetical protein